MASNTLDPKRAAAALPVSPAVSYRDDPDALSMHTTRGGYEYDDAPEFDDVPQLPSYDESVTAEGSSDDRAAPQPVDEYQIITAPKTNRNWGTKHTHSPHKAVGSETSIRMDERLLESKELYEYIENYLRMIPPRPMIRIQGWHWQKTKKRDKTETERIYDFNIVLNMQSLLPSSRDKGWVTAHTADNSDKVYRGSFRKTRAPGYRQDIEVGEEGTPDLREWCKRFAECKAALKIFRVERSVVGMNTDLIKEELEPLIRSTHYRGHIDITFPTADQNVDIYTPHWLNSARLSWVRWIFYLTFLWIFTWPVLFFMTKRWDVYNVQWSFSKIFTIDAEGRQEKRYAVMSERAWINRHADLVRSLVLDRFHGDGTDMPVNVDVDVEGSGRGARGQVPRTGNGSVDAAVGFIQGGVGAWNAFNGRAQREGWGADESGC
ncbi:hypothetical protein CLAFUW4_14739 [Fulvia fulva]|uniref:Uncharacterized protein n=1 Tax=Passalora fulva TaxID=5499 RepID=A0A9Q8UWH9_PASFU|nr:uncharacterized protein CLAFUR5_14566 [Fulvia fulva]KAK4609376.1 hypothetical protein CLAFUR4_14731 [Fulvia fulva]KAK4609484.1 hypothetical protein CLAFUR0_14731 [Fulvia fulva]UJO24927.1 hypothetical protein CLAFUR5_14566 [Fulvia fulva]WPV22501.1 hypothetical protein CLAFUW4_14739 [Fulvia fulva]WPV37773.1 hypothetical protein CLAFUW7_14740 [Fulvia fulva]